MKNISIGFVLVTYNKPLQTYKLLTTLNQLFDNPHISLHHDFSQSNLDLNKIPSNVSITEISHVTGWGRMSVIDATIDALKNLYTQIDAPEWFYLLSNACYPIKPPNKIIHDLANAQSDAYINHEKISYGNLLTDFQKNCFNRYCTVTPKIPGDSFIKKAIRKTLTMRHPLLTRNKIPFSKDFNCFAGEHWFCANKKAALHLIEHHEFDSPLKSHYRRSPPMPPNIPEESYYQTILCNSNKLMIENYNFRYIDWSLGGSHPKILTLDDFDKIASTPAHFARKFDLELSTPLMEKIDKQLLLL